MVCSPSHGGYNAHDYVSFVIVKLLFYVLIFSLNYFWNLCYVNQGRAFFSYLDTNALHHHLLYSIITETIIVEIVFKPGRGLFLSCQGTQS